MLYSRCLGANFEAWRPGFSSFTCRIYNIVMYFVRSFITKGSLNNLTLSHIISLFLFECINFIFYYLLSCYVLTASGCVKCYVNNSRGCQNSLVLH